MAGCAGRDDRIAHRDHTISLNCCRPQPGTEKQRAIAETAIERYRMNLREPNAIRASNGRRLNDYLRRKKSDDLLGTEYLTGQLFAGFGSLDE